jgi:pimeloyl-ACP methyl ester carboxylesterase
MRWRHSVTLRTITRHVGELQFEVDVAGEAHRPLVLLLHGWPQSSYVFREVLPVLARAGYLAVAPNQRGYSPGARPADLSAYATRLLMEDAIALARSFGAERFHLVGHDWGGQLAWLIAAYQPIKLFSLCELSRPHPAAFVEALATDPEQVERSSHHREFADLGAAARWVEDGAARLRSSLRDQGVPDAAVEAYVTRLHDVRAFDATLNWYRAAQANRSSRAAAPVPTVTVPTLYAWGAEDSMVGRTAAVATAAHVGGPYQFEILEGIGHYVLDQAPKRVIEMLVAHIARFTSAPL